MRSNASGETGKAVPRHQGRRVRRADGVRRPGEGRGCQPAHIHKGTCAKLDPKPTYPLSDVVGGMSKTTVPGITVAKLLAAPMAINVHKSAKELPTYVACGNISAKPGKM